MKKLTLLLTLISLFSITSLSNSNVITSNDTRAIIIGGCSGSSHHVCEPTVVYHLSTSTLTIDFGDQPIEDYSVTISSPFTDVDYYVTSSYTTIPLVVDGISDYTIITNPIIK